MPIWQQSSASDRRATAPLGFVLWWPRVHVFGKRPMTLLLMVAYLSEVSHIDHLPAGLTRIEMVSLDFRLSADSVTDNLPRPDHSDILRFLDAVSFIQSTDMRSTLSDFKFQLSITCHRLEEWCPGLRTSPVHPEPPLVRRLSPARRQAYFHRCVES